MVFSGDLLKETYSKFKPEYTCWFDKNTWKYLDKYQVLCLQVQVSTKYFWISKCQVQVSTKYLRFSIKYQVPSTSTLLDPNPGFKWGKQPTTNNSAILCTLPEHDIIRKSEFWFHKSPQTIAFKHVKSTLGRLSPDLNLMLSLPLFDIIFSEQCSLKIVKRQRKYWIPIRTECWFREFTHYQPVTHPTGVDSL